MLPYGRPLLSIALMAMSSGLVLAQQMPLPPVSNESASSGGYSEHELRERVLTAMG